MDYCLTTGDGTAEMLSAGMDTDIDGDGTFDAFGLDIDGDGLRDDALADLDGDGVADHAIRDVAGQQSWFTDDGAGTWLVPAERGGGTLRWFSLDGVESTTAADIDFDGDGVTDRLFDVDGDGLADRVLCRDGSGAFATAYVDTDADGHWDVRLTDADGDGSADSAVPL